MKPAYKILCLSLVSLATLGGCKKFRDINENPNKPENVDIKFVLPTAQAGTAICLGGQFQIIGGIWSQYWTQSPSSSQYRILDQYQVDGAFVNGVWTTAYSAALSDYEAVIANSGTQANYRAIAKIMKAFTYQMLTDPFGDIPFTEALKAESANITSPHYDPQETVYNGLIALVKEGMNEIDVNAAHPEGDDLIYGGDMEAWQKFGNTLLLRLYMRLSERAPSVAQQGIADLYANGIGFIEEGETAKIDYSSEAGNYNPLFSEMNNATVTRIQNLVASKTALDSFIANNDIRALIFYAPGTGGLNGLEQGFFTIQGVSGASLAHPSAAVGGDAQDDASALAPVIFISDYESLFLQAEAALRGWGTGDAQELYERGVAANFDAYAANFAQLQEDGDLPSLVADSLATSDTTGIKQDLPYNLSYVVNTYLHGDADLTGAGMLYLGGEQVPITPASFRGAYPATGTTAEKLEAIITQKWFSMCGNQGLEAWSEWRRTGYPDFFIVSRNSRLSGGSFPLRLPYPDGEVTNNLNFPGQKAPTERVWWDAN